MNNLMITILSLSLSGSIFIAILFICKPLYRERLSKRWQYYVWLIVVARLIVPFSFEVNFIGSLFDGLNQTSIMTFGETGEAGVNNAERNGALNIAGRDRETQIAIPNIPEVQTIPPYQQADIWSVILPNLWLIWLVVALMLFVRKVTIYQGFVRYIKAGRVPLSDMADLERFGKIVEESNIKGMVGIYTNNLISSPLLIGFFRPYIVLPTLDISESDFRYTVLHELTHYKRGDMFYKWLVQLAICLHWFNPFVYLMGREIENACEFSCDESIIRNLDNQGIRAYGDTLLNALGFGGAYKNSLSSVTLNESKKILGERLNMIKRFKRKSRLSVVCAVILTMVLSMGASVVGAYGMGNPSTDRPTTTITGEQRNPYFEAFFAKSESSISARSRTNNWSASDTISGNTQQQILDNKLQFIENIWQKEQAPFIIIEGISADDITDTDGLQYLFSNSSVYRDLITATDTLYILPESSFSRLSDINDNSILERYAFYLQNPTELSLSVFYELEAGRISVMIISPTGELLYQTAMTSRLDETITVQIEQGIGSIVLAYETVGGRSSGKINIMGML